MRLTNYKLLWYILCLHFKACSRLTFTRFLVAPVRNRPYLYPKAICSGAITIVVLHTPVWPSVNLSESILPWIYFFLYLILSEFSISCSHKEWGSMWVNLACMLSSTFVVVMPICIPPLYTITFVTTSSHNFQVAHRIYFWSRGHYVAHERKSWAITWFFPILSDYPPFQSCLCTYSWCNRWKIS